MRLCSVAECKRKHYAKGLCKSHYEKQRIYGEGCEFRVRPKVDRQWRKISEATAGIPLIAADGSVRAWALVDLEDAEWLSRWSWHLDPSGYAARHFYTGDRKVPGSRHKVYMHRQILGLKPHDPRYGDHINGNRLDNRRANLRIVTPLESAQNTSGRKRTSKFRGVSYRADRCKWRATHQVNGKRYFIGHFDTEEEAAIAARRWREQHMPFARDQDVP